MKRIMLILMLACILIVGCGDVKLQIAGSDERYIPLNKTCSTDQECIDYVNSQGGDGSPARCIDSSCHYPIKIRLPKQGD